MKIKNQEAVNPEMNAGFLSDNKLTNDRASRRTWRMKKKVFPVSMAVLWGCAFAESMHSWTLGICMGMMMGIVFGLFDSDNNNDHEQE